MVIHVLVTPVGTPGFALNPVPGARSTHLKKRDSEEQDAIRLQRHVTSGRTADAMEGD